MCVGRVGIGQERRGAGGVAGKVWEEETGGEVIYSVIGVSWIELGK